MMASDDTAGFCHNCFWLDEDDICGCELSPYCDKRPTRADTQKCWNYEYWADGFFIEGQGEDGHMDFNNFALEIHSNSVRHGFWPDDRSDSEVIALIHSEFSEALESYRNNEPLIWHECKWVPRAGDTPDPARRCEAGACMRFGKDADLYAQHAHAYIGDDTNGDHSCMEYNPKPEGVATELIDGCIRILDAAAVWCGAEMPHICTVDDDLAEAIKRWSLPALVAFLHQETTELWHFRGDDVVNGCTKVGIQSKYIIDIVYIWLKEQGVDPDAIMLEKHEYNLTRPYKHGKRI